MDLENVQKDSTQAGDGGTGQNLALAPYAMTVLISDDRPDRALVVAVWRAKSDSQEFYKNRAPLLDLKPFLEGEHIEHYYLETSSVFKIASGVAA